MPTIGEIVTQVLGQFRMIRSAPVPYIAAVVGILFVVWFAMEWGYRRTIANGDSEIRSLNTQLNEYKSKVGGASPDEVKAKLAELSEITKQTVGNPWRALTAQEKGKFKSAAKSIPPRFINVMYSNFRGKELAQSFAEALKAAGWDQVNLSQGDLPLSFSSTRS